MGVDCCLSAVSNAEFAEDVAYVGLYRFDSDEQLFGDLSWFVIPSPISRDTSVRAGSVLRGRPGIGGRLNSAHHPGCNLWFND